MPEDDKPDTGIGALSFVNTADNDIRVLGQEEVDNNIETSLVCMMSDKFKKDSTPPPLLLMPAGGGLTLNPPDQPNVLMPVVQSAPSLLDPEIEAEADSFVGQSPPSHKQPSSSNDLPSNYFQPAAGRGSDPFAQVGSQTFQLPSSNSFSPQPPPMSQVPPNIGPPTSLGPPPPSGGGGNMYRQQGGRPQYALPPSGLLSSQPPQMMSPGPPPQQPPFSSPQPPTAMVPPMPPMGGGANSPPTNNPPSSLATIRAGQDNPAQYTGGLYYQPVRYHWCYQENQGGVEVWRPFSVIDSTQLELAFTMRLKESPNDTIVITNGGRYEVNVGNRMRTSVFWNQGPASVRRCSWFFKREGDNRYVPYEEEFSFILENEYKKALETNGWHRRLEFPGKEIVVMHNANVFVQFPSSSAPDEWGNVQSLYSPLGDQMRPRVVKRGVDDFASIEYGEREVVDHLVFFVPGIEEFTDGKSKSLEEYVDDFRSNALTLIQSHFTAAFNSKTVNRVEFLPVLWTKALEEDTTDLLQLVNGITLPSTVKLRSFINSTMVDTLFYSSPNYCQKICETIGNEMNRMFHIFLEKHQSFSGDVSLAGHSLGATILFDLLLHQSMPGEVIAPPPSNDIQASTVEQSNTPSIQDSLSASSDATEEPAEKEDDMNLETILSMVGLSDKVSLFQEEQIDMESLIMCSEQDLKDIGLPMGPRKKLIGLLKEEKEKKDEKAKAQAMKKMQEDMEKMKMGARQSAAVLNTNTNNVMATPAGGSEIVANYLKGFGVGQLKVHYPQLDFTPSALFAMGSPIALYLTLRGIDDVGEFFQLPTCPRVFNIFHPFDPMAFRLEPLLRSSMTQIKPVQVPHYKGRKRLHLEFKEAVTRYGTDIKQKIMEGLKSTWTTINDFAKAHRSDAKPGMEKDVQSEVDHMMKQISQQHADDDVASVSSMSEEEIQIGQLNEGQRIDYQLQEGPLESFNDYLFSITSHSCYWDSEDTALLMLKEIYSPLGVRPVMPGKDGGMSSLHPRAPPPLTSTMTPPRPPPTGYPPPQSAASVYSSQSQATFAPTPFHNSTPPPSQPVGPPPPMFNPLTSSSQPAFSQSPGFRKSPYVPPDFNNLPATASPSGQSPAGPPPMGPAMAGGYRRTGPV